MCTRSRVIESEGGYPTGDARRPNYRLGVDVNAMNKFVSLALSRYTRIKIINIPECHDAYPSCSVA